MPIDITDPAQRARFKEILENIFFAKYLRLEPRPYPIPPLLPPSGGGDPDPQPNFESLLITELLINSLKYTEFKKEDNSFLKKLKEGGLAKESLENLHEKVKDSLSSIENDLSLI